MVGYAQLIHLLYKEKQRVRTYIKNIGLLIVSTIFSLLILEVGLRWFTGFPINFASNKIPDEQLGYRVDPARSDIDNNGFRNPQVLEEADIIALGDSHTFGVNVAPEYSWPQQLAKMTNKTVYNFGVSSYNILQYHYLMDQAIKLKPQHIIWGLYLANDLSDVCDFVRKVEFWRKWTTANHYNFKSCSRWIPSLRTDSFESFLRKNTAIVSALRHIILNAKWTSKWMYNKNNAIIIDEAQNKTVIKHSMILAHEKGMNMNRQEISLAFDIAKQVIKEAKQKSDENNISLNVLFIPSKERVFYNYLINKKYELPKSYHNLVKSEQLLVDRFSSLLKEMKIKFVDVQPYMVHEIHKSGSVYSYGKDGHPLKIGYRVYAQAAYENFLQ